MKRVLKERLPFWEGTVRERIAILRKRAPLLAAADEQQLRETFLSARVREYRDGEIIIRQNDYTNDFLIIADGRVELWKKPEKATAEVKIVELTAGNFFGEMSLISGRRRTATARAIGRRASSRSRAKPSSSSSARLPERKRSSIRPSCCARSAAISSRAFRKRSSASSSSWRSSTISPRTRSSSARTNRPMPSI